MNHSKPTLLTSPRRSAFSPGRYLARLPGLSRRDLRIEAPATRLDMTATEGFSLLGTMFTTTKVTYTTGWKFLHN